MKWNEKALILVGCLLMTSAFAHDHHNPALNGWYPTLHSRVGSPCCDGSDIDDGNATALDEADWDSKDGHFRVFVEGKWWDVPDSAIVDVPNKDGRPIVWFYWNRSFDGHDKDELKIRCFIQGGGF